MQKQAPSLGRILVAVGFTLSCFGLILFLWIAFGGPIPLSPKSYRITAYFPEGATLAQESDVRIGGVSVGRVKTIELAPPEYRVNGKDTTEAVIEIEPEFAPISTDAKAIVRQKTLLGEAFVELTSGTEEGAPVSLGEAAQASTSDAEAEGVEAIPEGGTLGVGQTVEATQIDEIFNALDEETRLAFQRWQQNAAIAIEDRGLDLNDTLGNIGPFLGDATDILTTLRRQKKSLQGLVRDTGVVFEALSERDQELAGAITNTEATFGALASESEALAETFQILPTFERESRFTFTRLDEFQSETRPLVRELIPVARDLSPTLASVRRLSPHLRSLFIDLDELVDASRRGLPALAKFLDGLGPVLDALEPFLANLNPVLRYLEAQKHTVADFLAGPSVALSGSVDERPGDPAPRHYLRQLGYVSPETLSMHQTRLATNRGNGYLAPLVLNDRESASGGIFPNFDCRNTDYTEGSQDPDEDEVLLGETPPADVHGGLPPDAGFAPCFAPDHPFGTDFGGGRFPQVAADP